MITLQGVTKSFGDNEVLKGINLEVAPGSVHGYLGPNGAGKTTTIKIMLGILEPDGGRATIAGVDPQVDPVAARSHVGYVPEVLSIYEHLTPFEFLHVVGEIHGMERAMVRERAMDFMNLLQLSSVVHQRMAAFSRGMKQKVMVAAALIHDPQVILLDEPLSGMDVNSILVFRDLIRRLADEGKTVIYSSHMIEVVERVCDHVTVLIGGEITHRGTMEEVHKEAGSLEEIFRREAVGEAFFSLSADIIGRL